MSVARQVTCPKCHNKHELSLVDYATFVRRYGVDPGYYECSSCSNEAHNEGFRSEKWLRKSPYEDDPRNDTPNTTALAKQSTHAAFDKSKCKKQNRFRRNVCTTRRPSSTTYTCRSGFTQALSELEEFIEG
jgi:hypothetical protein